jgi:hypothetical protein
VLSHSVHIPLKDPPDLRDEAYGRQLRKRALNRPWIFGGIGSPAICGQTNMKKPAKSMALKRRHLRPASAVDDFSWRYAVSI